MKTINTSFYDFPRLIKDGHVYVDKTAQLYELAKPGADNIYYLPRPRRFGKSLMIFDALKAKNAAPVDFASEFDVATLDAPDALAAPTVALLYQGGYLTIDERIDGETVRLRIPNHEVRNSLYRGYMSSVLGVDYDSKARTFDDVRTEPAPKT